ncbi:MAG: GGDEF domain-containing response regulator [Dokdonella sp.]
MTRQDPPINLLLIEDSADDAQQLNAVLRNGAIAVRPSRAVNEAELEDLLERQTPDLILINIGSADVSLQHCMDAVGRTGKDIVVIAYGAQLSEEAMVTAIREGARTIILHNRPEHVQMVVRREFESLTTRRSVRRLEGSLREAERRCGALLDSSRDPVAYVHEGMHVRANRAYLETFQFDDFEDIEGLSILDLIAADDADDFKSLLRRLSKGEKPPQKLNLKAQRNDGSTFDAIMEFSEANYEGEACQQIIFRQQMVDAALAEELDALRSKDLVTDLFNRQYLLTELEHATAAAANGKMDQALLLLEPDNFKVVLDGIGLGNTDLLLGDMANLLRRHLRDGDIPGRIGDHTFGVVVAERSMEEVHLLAETLRKAFEDRIFEVGKQSITLTVSVSGSLLGEKNTARNVALEQASGALRNAQTEGGNRVNIFDPTAQDKADAQKHRHWLKLIDDALNNDGFVLYYQPIVSMQGSDEDFYEVLLRMKGPQGEILPNHFLPIAEQHNLLMQIYRWVIAKAIQTLAARQQAEQKTILFIKLTPQSLDDQGLVPWIALQLKNARLGGDSLVFEMPESKVVTSLKPARAFFKSLEQLHCGFALEQFGSGLNSFQLLKHVPAHYLKIDRNFMLDLSQNKENQERIKSICEQARALGKLTVAEFVEDAGSMSILFSCGVNFVQGNFLREPGIVMDYDFGH